MQTSIPLAFGDGEYVFALPIKQIVALEGKAGLIDEVRHRLMNGGFGIRDVTEVIRHGLIGGGHGEVDGVVVEVGELRANSLIDTYIEGKPLGEIALLARAVVATLYVGYAPPEGLKKKRVSQKSRVRSTGASSSTTASPSG